GRWRAHHERTGEHGGRRVRADRRRQARRIQESSAVTRSRAVERSGEVGLAYLVLARRVPAMLPVIALVGRPNVGKSTLFNVLTGTRDALVADEPGLTRDRKYGYGKIGPVPYIVVDTGGLVADAEGIEELMARQTLRAVEEADRVLFLVDVREGLTPSDHFVAQTLRKHGKDVVLVANKAEGLDRASAAADFYQLGFGEPQPISSAHGDGIRALMEHALAGFEVPEAPTALERDDAIRVAVSGRPNVGKSTLINRLVGEERLIAYDQPGTTRDTVLVPFERDGRKYVLIDTAGVRRR